MDKSVDESVNESIDKPADMPVDILVDIPLDEMAIINKVAKRWAARFRFGYHEIKDMEQEARVIAWEGITKHWDGVRPLENFLWVHVHNRLFNFKRDNFFRPNGHCEKCEFYNKKCLKYDQIEECESYQQWWAKNTAKLNLIYPIEFSCVDDYGESGMRDSVWTEDQVFNNELEVILNRHIPLEHRHNYLRLRYGYRVSSQYRIPLVEIIQSIVQKYWVVDGDGE